MNFSQQMTYYMALDCKYVNSTVSLLVKSVYQVIVWPQYYNHSPPYSQH